VRKFFSFVAIAACFVLLLGSAKAERSDITLRVGNFGGVFTAAQKKYVGDLFTQRTGIKIEYIDANPVDHVAKLVASRGREVPYDVVYLDEIAQVQAIAAGVIDKIDPALVPNLKFLYPEALHKDGYAPAFMFYSMGIAYNYEKLKAAGIPEITSWADLWNPKLAGRVAVPDLTIVQGRNFAIAAARLDGGDERSLEKGIDKLATLKAHSYPASSATIETLFRSGDIWVAPWLNGRAWGMIDKGFPLRYVIPKEGGFAGWGSTDLVRGTKYPKEAQAYINLVLDPLAQLGQANEIPYGPTNKLLVPVLAAYPELSKKFPSSADDISKLMRPDWAYFNDNYRKSLDLWNRKVIRK